MRAYLSKPGPPLGQCGKWAKKGERGVWGRPQPVSSRDFTLFWDYGYCIMGTGERQERRAQALCLGKNKNPQVPKKPFFFLLFKEIFPAIIYKRSPFCGNEVWCLEKYGDGASCNLLKYVVVNGHDFQVTYPGNANPLSKGVLFHAYLEGFFL